MKLSTIFKNGIIFENPIFVQLIGMCSVLAITNSVKNSIGMGAAVVSVLVMSNIVISIMRKVIPSKIRIPIFIVVIATFVTMVEMFMKAYAQPLYLSLGIFIPLIVVNCLILARAESFASKNGVFYSAMDGLAMGLGYSAALLILGSLREILGAGSFYGISLFGESFQPAAVFVAPPGAFILLGILIALFNKFIKQRAAN
ncbi:MAG: electron transport complex subunit E [Gudongella sp.]|nr:electron transport complex subunit E [Gudongella sp.]